MAWGTKPSNQEVKFATDTIKLNVIAIMIVRNVGQREGDEVVMLYHIYTEHDHLCLSTSTYAGHVLVGVVQ